MKTLTSTYGFSSASLEQLASALKNKKDVNFAEAK